MIAASLACNPELVIFDEPTTATDVIVARKVLDMVKELRRKMDLTIMVITHDMSTIAWTCDDVGIMYAGKLVELSDVTTLFDSSVHPYSKALISSFPSIKDNPNTQRRGITGSPPSLLAPPSGCRFHPRCPFAEDICKTMEPELIEVEKGHFVACHLSK
jgi:peptide/nickel transport system ATP-binding protein